MRRAAITGDTQQELAPNTYNAADYQAAVEGAKALPKPVWAQQERFPFLKSNFNIVGMFLTDIPTSDNLTQFRGYITMR